MARIVLLLPAATYRAEDFLDAARRLDAEVVVVSDHRSTLAGVMGNRSLRVDLRRPDQAAARITALAGRMPVDAVVAVDDQGVTVAALASAALGLAHNPVDAVLATRDKARMRAALHAGGVAQPGFRVVHDLAQVACAADDVGLPCVVKPVSLSGSRGVIRADTPAQAEAAAARITAILSDAGEDSGGPLLVERFMDGAEVAVEGLLRRGSLEILAVFDKPDPLDGPYFEETLYVTPSRLPAGALAVVEGVTADACRALGLLEGPVHAELRVRDGRAWVLEIAARSIGGLCARSLRFGLGTTLEEVILRHALGLPLRALLREGAAAGVMMLPIPRSGVLREVRGLDAALAVPGVEGAEITVPRGRPVQALPEADRYLGFLFARGRTPEDVEAALRAGHAALDVVIDGDDSSLLRRSRSMGNKIGGGTEWAAAR